MNTSFSEICEVATAITDDDSALFVGAGMSATAGSLTWDELAQTLKSDLQPNTSETNPILIAQYYRNQWGEHRFLTKLRSIITQKHLQPTKAHKHLCALPTNVVVTTNFDDLLEQTFQILGRRHHTILDNKELAFWNEKDEVQLIKIHGDINSSNSLIFSEEDYSKFLNVNLALQRKLCEIFMYRTTIFIGYSLRDPDISYIYNTVLHEFGKTKRPAYIFTFENDPHVLNEWFRRGIKPVPIKPAVDQSKTEAVTDALRALHEQVNLMQSGSGCDILIVEDDMTLLDIISDLIKDKFPHVTIHLASNGIEATLAIGKLHPKVIWTDLYMPGMDGIELMRHIRCDPDLKDTEIIICTGHDSDEFRIHAAKYGTSFYFTKPVIPEIALQALSQCLSNHSVPMGTRESS